MLSNDNFKRPMLVPSGITKFETLIARFALDIGLKEAKVSPVLNINMFFTGNVLFRSTLMSEDAS